MEAASDCKWNCCRPTRVWRDKVYKRLSEGCLQRQFPYARCEFHVSGKARCFPWNVKQEPRLTVSRVGNLAYSLDRSRQTTEAWTPMTVDDSEPAATMDGFSGSFVPDTVIRDSSNPQMSFDHQLSSLPNHPLDPSEDYEIVDPFIYPLELPMFDLTPIPSNLLDIPLIPDLSDSFKKFFNV